MLLCFIFLQCFGCCCCFCPLPPILFPLFTRFICILAYFHTNLTEFESRLYFSAITRHLLQRQSEQTKRKEGTISLDQVITNLYLHFYDYFVCSQHSPFPLNNKTIFHYEMRHFVFRLMRYICYRINSIWWNYFGFMLVFSVQWTHFGQLSNSYAYRMSANEIW